MHRLRSGGGSMRVVFALLLATGHCAFAADPENTDWPLLGNAHEMQHHAALSQINTDTVGRLGLAWWVDLPAVSGLVGNPLIRDGRVFQSGAGSRIFANDLRTESCCGPSIRGLTRRTARSWPSTACSTTAACAARGPRHRRHRRLPAGGGGPGDRRPALGSRRRATRVPERTLITAAPRVGGAWCSRCQTPAGTHGSSRGPRRRVRRRHRASRMAFLHYGSRRPFETARERPLPDGGRHLGGRLVRTHEGLRQRVGTP